MTRFLMWTALAGVLAAVVGCQPARAEDVKQPGIVTSTGATVTVSTRAMQPGGEMWALWYDVFSGTRVDYPGTNKAKWSGLEIVLSGSSTSEAKSPPGTCFAFGPGWQRDLSAGTLDLKPGDATACNYAADYAFWEKNPGPEAYRKAGLYIGGPSAPDDIHVGPEYEKAGGHVDAAGFDPAQFELVFPQLLKAGAMTATIRQVVMPPGARMVVSEPFPVLRRVVDGSLALGQASADSDPATLKIGSEASAATWIQWVAPRWMLIANTSDKPALFVEWSVAPAPGAAP